jgi:predicted HAD superfamily Cof-like phosphohydrolase
MSVLDLMTPEQRERAKEPMAMTLCKLPVRFPMGSHPQQLTGHFHQVTNLPINPAPILPGVSERLRRGMLLLEEVLETFAAMGLELVVRPTDKIGDGTHNCRVEDGGLEWGAVVTLEHIEGSRYDVVETADGLSDISAIVAGTAVEFGIPTFVTDYEVYSSNLTKVLPDGTTLVNGVTEGYREGEPGYQPNRPVGKVLKPDNFVPANIAAALLAYENQEF